MEYRNLELAAEVLGLRDRMRWLEGHACDQETIAQYRAAKDSYLSFVADLVVKNPELFDVLFKI